MKMFPEGHPALKGKFRRMVRTAILVFLVLPLAQVAAAGKPLASTSPLTIPTPLPTTAPASAPAPVFPSSLGSPATAVPQTAPGTKLVEWNQPVPHVFFHPLLAWPEVAWKPGKWRSHMYEWFVTARELRAFLDSVYARNYVIVDIYKIIKENPDGSWSFVPFLFPEGKIPLLLSIDDLNYYGEMRWTGTVSRLEVNEKNELQTRTTRVSQMRVKAGKGDRTDSDNEIPLILEQFIQAHPDFSFEGGRGIIAVTGKRGLFGWPTHLTSAPDYAEARAGAQAVADKLREMGWRFASHSYFHLHRRDQKDEDFRIAEERWMTEAGSIIGPTPLYIFPFGEPVSKMPGHRKVLDDLGFRVFFTVESAPVQSVDGDWIIQGRVPLDGRALDGKFGQLSLFCKRTEIRDPGRPVRPPELR